MSNIQVALRRRVRAASVLGAAVLVCVALGATMQQAQSDWIRHSYEVLRIESQMRLELVIRDSTMLRYLDDIPTMETAERGRILEEAEQSYLCSEVMRAKLIELTADNPDQGPRLQAAGSAMARIRARLDELHEDISEGRTGDARALLAATAYEDDRRTIRDAMNAFDQEEVRLLDARETSHTRWALLLWAALGALVTLCVILLHALRRRLVTEVNESERYRAYLETLLGNDAATGLRSRHWLAQRFDMDTSRLVRDGGQLGIVLLGIDSLKPVRDAWGQEARDVMLRGILSRVNRCLATSDVLARVADDQLAILVTDLGSTGATRRAVDLIEALAESLDGLIDIIDGLHVTPEVRVGIAGFPDDGRTLDSLVAAATSAMRPLAALRRPTPDGLHTTRQDGAAA